SRLSSPTEKQEHPKPPSTGAIIGGILGTLAVIGLISGIILYIRCRRDDGEGPPKHKPPPPVKGSSSTEMLTKPEPPTTSERVPLSPREVYYEPTGREPVTNLDDGSSGALNGGAPPGLDTSAQEFIERPDGHHGNDFDSSNHGAPAGSVSRGDSFVSPAMYV
ncbi:hypothetical protein OJAV_G00110830, partial [Oryzias javanicus]